MIIKSILQLVKSNQISKDLGLKMIQNIQKLKGLSVEDFPKVQFAKQDIYVEGHKVFDQKVLLGATYIS